MTVDGLTWEDDVRTREEAGWVSKRAAMSMLLDDTHAVVTRSELDSLMEYSRSIPSGTYVGKVWKRRQWLDRDAWILGEYVDVGSNAEIGIKWRSILVVE